MASQMHARFHTWQAPFTAAHGQNLRLRHHRSIPQHAAAQGASEPYIGTDGRRKATLEEAFRMDRRITDAMPWQLSWQRNERALKFSDETRAHMIKGFAARELGISDEVMDRRLQELVLLLPELPAKLAVMKPQAVAALAADTNALALRLVRLKGIFPQADAAAMVVKQPLLLMARTPEQLEQAASQLRQLLPDFDVDCWPQYSMLAGGSCKLIPLNRLGRAERELRCQLVFPSADRSFPRLCQQYPNVALDPDGFAETVQEAKRMMPDMDVRRALYRNPASIFGFERRKNMIEYDS